MHRIQGLFLLEISFRQLTLRGSINPCLNKLARNKRDTGNVSFLIATSSDWLGLAAAATAAAPAAPASAASFAAFAAAAFASSTAFARVRFDRFLESK